MSKEKIIKKITIDIAGTEVSVSPEQATIRGKKAIRADKRARHAAMNAQEAK